MLHYSRVLPVPRLPTGSDAVLDFLDCFSLDRDGSVYINPCKALSTSLKDENGAVVFDRSHYNWITENRVKQGDFREILGYESVFNVFESRA
jgi:hypothetical protein